MTEVKLYAHGPRPFHDGGKKQQLLAVAR